MVYVCFGWIDSIPVGWGVGGWLDSKRFCGIVALVRHSHGRNFSFRNLFIFVDNDKCINMQMSVILANPPCVNQRFTTVEGQELLHGDFNRRRGLCAVANAPLRYHSGKS